MGACPYGATRSSSHYVPSLKIFFNSFLVLINQLPSCFVLCLSSCVCLRRLTLLTFVHCAFDMIQLKRYIIISFKWFLSTFRWFTLVLSDFGQQGTFGQHSLGN